MKTLFAIFIAISLSSVTAFAAEHVNVTLDGRALQLDPPALVESGRTLVPLRGVFEELGALVFWNGETRTVNAIRGDTVVRLTIGSKDAYVDKELKLLDVPATIIDGRTFVPLRFLSESLGCAVSWDGASYTAGIKSNSENMGDPGDNLSWAQLLETTWEATDGSGDVLRFVPEDFAELDLDFPDNADPDKLYFSFSETSSDNMILMFLGGAHLKDHYFIYDPDSAILTDYLFDDILGQWKAAASSEAESGKLITADGAAWYLLASLSIEGENTEGTATLQERESQWKSGEKAWHYAWGKNTKEKFTAERRFAVTESGDIWEYSIVDDDYSLFHSMNIADKSAISPSIQEALDLASLTAITINGKPMKDGAFTAEFFTSYLYSHVNRDLFGNDSRISDIWDDRGFAISSSDFSDIAEDCFGDQALPLSSLAPNSGFTIDKNDKNTVYFMPADGDQMTARFVPVKIGVEINRTYVAGYIEVSYAEDEPFTYQGPASATLSWSGKTGADSLLFFTFPA
ncbi:MAG: copper amine oxidase N-terminal domain-containing protein [Clostridiales bacterium]|jgi:hypothetical protein|nr:copper amine oxidase N-terminal domain-containing protein [Clostridiales bacterium]